MFDNIAPTYDTLNHRLSWEIDKRWRKKAIKQLLPYQPQSILDIATGTGDFAIQSAKMLKPKAIIGADISTGMMKIGEKKVKEEGLEKIISFQKEDCLNLSFPSNTFDAVTAAFGIESWRTFVYHRTNDSYKFSHESPLQNLLKNRSSVIRSNHFERQKCL